MQYIIENVVHAEEVLRSVRAKMLVQMAMAFLTVPEQRLALASPRMEPRRGRLPAFGRNDDMREGMDFLVQEGQEVFIISGDFLTRARV